MATKRGSKPGKSTKKLKSMPLSAKKAKRVKGGSFSIAGGHEKWIEATGWIETIDPFGRKI